MFLIDRLFHVFVFLIDRSGFFNINGNLNVLESYDSLSFEEKYGTLENFMIFLLNNRSETLSFGAKC